mgnify:CR=1 FL=1
MLAAHVTTRPARVFASAYTAAGFRAAFPSVVMPAAHARRRVLIPRCIAAMHDPPAKHRPTPAASRARRGSCIRIISRFVRSPRIAVLIAQLSPSHDAVIHADDSTEREACQQLRAQRRYVAADAQRITCACGATVTPSTRRSSSEKFTMIDAPDAYTVCSTRRSSVRKRWLSISSVPMRWCHSSA